VGNNKRDDADNKKRITAAEKMGTRLPIKG
jgi:hypothetical protein